MRLGLELFSETVRAAVLGVTLWVLVSRVVAGNMQVGTFTFLLVSAIGLQDAASGFFLAIAEQRKDARPVASFFDVMGQKRSIESLEFTARHVRKDRAPTIEFRNVSFAYPGTKKLVLRDFSLTINPGERVALVGVNGAGKSTLTKLLCRFYDPTKGEILVDGINLRLLNLDSWHHALGVLAQDFEIHRLTASEVIALGRSDCEVDHFKVQSSATLADAASFIEQWPNKYQQQIGIEFTDGVNPSGGQSQKLALARTLYRDALVTVLDEPTAHVDADAEQQIFEGLESRLRRDQTLVLISHRFSTVRTADRICVIKKGTVAELGSHDELVAQNGIYAGLFEKQAKGYR